MQRLKTGLLWLMDVMVAVFIGPVDAGKRSSYVRRMAARRGVYALAFTGIVVLAAVVYTFISRMVA